MSSNPHVMLPFVVEQRVLALEALRVLEIVGRSEVVALPQGPACVPGAIAWRGRALALLELGPALGLAAPAHRSRARNLVIQLRDEVVALAADRVLETLHLAQPAQPSDALELALPCRGAIELGEQRVGVLDVERWVEQLRGSP